MNSPLSSRLPNAEAPVPSNDRQTLSPLTTDVGVRSASVVNVSSAADIFRAVDADDDAAGAPFSSAVVEFRFSISVRSIK